jgi:hypothetical protein
MRRPIRYLLAGHAPVACADIQEWARRFERDERRVRVTRVGKYRVSTVFLGLDHRFHGSGPPLVFETMIFTPENRSLDYQTRCATWREAGVQHEEAIAHVAQPGDKPEQIYPAPVKK